MLHVVSGIGARTGGPVISTWYEHALPPSDVDVLAGHPHPGRPGHRSRRPASMPLILMFSGRVNGCARGTPITRHAPVPFWPAVPASSAVRPNATSDLPSLFPLFNVGRDLR